MTTAIRSSGSIRRQLTMRLVAAAALLAGLLFVIVVNFASRLATESQDNILIASATAMLESATVQNDSVTVDIPYASLAMLGNVSDDRVFYRITANGDLLTGYGDLPTEQGAPNDLGQRFVTADYSGESVRMASASRRIASTRGPVDISVSVAQTRGGQRETLQTIWRRSAMLGAGFFVVAVALAVLAAQATVGPLMRLADSVSRRGPQDLRPVQAAVPNEMQPLVDALNRFILRLQTTLSRSEDFIAEAAHRVRTPLATVRTQAEVVLRRVEKPENRASLKEMIRAVDESSRAAGQLLDHAMVTFRTDQLEHEEIDLRGLIDETVRRLHPVAGLKDIEMTVQAPTDAMTHGDGILIQSALGNVLDNAIKYSPTDSDVEVRLIPTDLGHEIRVFDQGLGFPTGMGRRLTRRFARGSNSTGTVGSGLGLTIAQEVTSAHGGRLEIGSNPKGKGACVTLFFPRP